MLPQPLISALVRRIEIHTSQLAKDILAGTYRSAFKGWGMEFEEVREYQPGDDIRTIDWPVTARMDHPFIKIFREERELTLMLLIDISASSRFGSKNKTKRDLICEIAALLAFSAIKNNDKVGMILFTDRVEKYFPPRKTSRHVLRLIRELLVYEPKHTRTNIAAALAFLGKVASKSGVCFLISDFISPDFHHEAQLIALKHDLIGIGVTDPNEINLPPLGIAALQDLESSTSLLADTSIKSLQKRFQAFSEERIDLVQDLLRKMGAGFIDIRTQEPYLSKIKNFFKFRSRHPK